MTKKKSNLPWDSGASAGTPPEDLIGYDIGATDEVPEEPAAPTSSYITYVPSDEQEVIEIGVTAEPEEEVVEDVSEPTPMPENVPIDPNEYMAGAPTIDAPAAPELGAAPTVTEAPEFGAPTIPGMPGVTAVPTIPGMTVAPAPEYEITPEQQAWQDLYSGEIQDIISAKGRGISDKAQHLMMRKATLMLQSRETENLRLMANDMERRGITDSGQIFDRTQQIKSTTTRALAASITDIGIKSELMKMESFERAMGHAANYLSYLSNQSKMKYGSKMATWHAQTQVNMVQYQAKINASLEAWKMENQFNMVEWQANKDALFAEWKMNATSTMAKWEMTNQFAMEEWKVGAQYDLALHQINSQIALAQFQAKNDIYKMGIAQAYQQNNMNLAAQIAEEYAENRHDEDIILAEMQIEHEKAAASASGFGNFIGMLLGGIFGWLF